MVTHNYGSADGATYQTVGAEVRLQEAVGLREGDWRRCDWGRCKDALGRFAGSVKMHRIWRDASFLETAFDDVGESRVEECMVGGRGEGVIYITSTVAWVLFRSV